MPAFELPRRIQASEERVEGSKVSGVGGGGDQDLRPGPDAAAAGGPERGEVKGREKKGRESPPSHLSLRSPPRSAPASAAPAPAPR